VTLVLTSNYIDDSVSLFRYYKKLAERAMAQVTDDEFFRAVAPGSNSIAIVVKHLSGNLKSRWTDFLTTDGEKPWRNRDSEFELEESAGRAALMDAWESAWTVLFGSIEPLSEGHLGRTVTIRGEAHSVMQAINRALAHCAYHAGQIVFAAKQLRGGRFETLTVPRGQSAEFNRRVRTRESSQR
jgi:hypothetical protein